MKRIKFNRATREKIIRAFAAGSTMKQIGENFGVSMSKIRKFLAPLNLTRGEPVDDIDLEMILDDSEAADPDTAPVGNGIFTELAQPNATMELLNEFTGTAEEAVREAVRILQTDTTPQGISRALSYGIPMQQLLLVALNPPPVENWADVERLVNMSRKSLDMDRKVKTKDGVDANAFNLDTLKIKAAKKATGTVIDTNPEIL